MPRAILLAIFVLVSVAMGSLRSPLRQTWRTEHFELSVPATVSNDVPRLAGICELVYDSLSAFYGYSLPHKERFKLVFLDEEDYSNGFAIGFAGWVAIYMAPGDFDLRGSPGWHANVLAHELSHLFSLRKLGYTFSYLGHSTQWTGYRKRGMVSVSQGPIPMDEESWLVEGLAQLGAEACGLDRWDAMRDALERESWFSGDLPSLLSLKTFHQDSRKAELLYNQGYSFLHWVRKHLSKPEWANFMNTAEEHSIHTAVENAFSKSFTEVFENWRTERKERHLLFQASKDTISLDSFTHSDRYQIQARSIWTTEGVYSLSSSENETGSLRLFGPHGNVVSSDANGVLWANRTGTRVLFGTNELDWRNVHRNQLYEIYPIGSSPRKVQGGERVYSACISKDGLWVIYHDLGRNHLGKLENGSIQSFAGMPGALEPLEMDCQEEQNQIVVSATHGTGRALYLVNPMQDSLRWKKIVGNPEEDVRNPILVGDTVYFSADFSSSFQVYKMNLADSAQPLLLTNLRGGAFYPNSSPSGLSYSVFQNGSFFRIHDTANRAEKKVESVVKEPSFVPYLNKIRKVNTAPFHKKADGMSYLGWATILDFTTGLPDLLDSGEVSGRVWSWTGIGAVLFADLALTNMVELQAGLTGMKHSDAYSDQPGYIVGAGWSTSNYSPDLVFQAQYQAVPLESHGGSVFPDSVQDELSETPWLSFLLLQSLMNQPISNRTALQANFQYQSIGIQDKKATQGQTITFLEQAQGLLALTWYDLEQGRRHYNSGVGLVAGGGFQWMGIAPMFTDISFTMPMFVTQLSLFENWNRWIYFGTNLSATAVHIPQLNGDSTSTEEGWRSLLGAQMGLDIPFPWRVSGIFPGAKHSLAWTNMELHLGYGVEWTDSLLSGGASEYAPFRRGKAPSSYFSRKNIATEAMSWNRPSVLLQNCEVSLRWETLTFANSLSQWEMGVVFPPEDPKKWMMFVGISL